MAQGELERLVEAAIAGAQESSNGWWRANCPVCPLRVGKDDSRLSLAFLPAESHYHCKRCKISGRLRGNFHEMAEQNPHDDEEKLPEIMQPPEGYMELGTEPGRSALVTYGVRGLLGSRGVTRKICERSGVGVTYEGFFRNRIIVPITARNRPDVWMGYVGRTINDSEPKYLYPKGMRRGQLLFNERQLYRETADPIIAVEGVFDALPHWPYCVACLGKPTEDQFEMMLEAERPIVVCLDGDAWEEGKAWCMRLRVAGHAATCIRLPPRVDPGNIERGSLLRYAREALAADEYPYRVDEPLLRAA